MAEVKKESSAEASDSKVFEVEQTANDQQAPNQGWQALLGEAGNGGNFFQRYRKLIAAGFGVLAAGAIAVALYGEYAQGNAEEAQTAALASFRLYEQDSTQKALTGEMGRLGLERVVAEYGSTPTGNLARLYAGAALLEQGQAQKAIEYLEAFDLADDLPSAMALSALATAYEGAGDFEKAAKTFEKAAQTMPNQHTTPAMLFQAARCYEEAQNTEAALNLYKRIRKQFPTSEESGLAEKLIYALGGSI